MSDKYNVCKKYDNFPLISGFNVAWRMTNRAKLAVKFDLQVALEKRYVHMNVPVVLLIMEANMFVA